MLAQVINSTNLKSFSAAMLQAAVPSSTYPKLQAEPLTYIIEDDIANNFLCKITLRDAGITNTASFYMAHLALNDLQQKLSNNQAFPALILLDINMPAMDGWAFLDEYRKFPHTVTLNTKILLFSTSSNLRDITKVQSYPEVQDFLEKPISEEAASQLKQKYFCTAA